MVKVSRKFVEAVKLADKPAYRIAQQAGIDSPVLSKLLHGNGKVWLNDRRVLAVGRVLGLDPDECFATRKKELNGSTMLTQRGPEDKEGEIDHR